MPPLPPHEIYAAKLAHLSLGYALFEPDPNDAYDRVRVGDVGYIWDGKFIRLFNAFSRARASENVNAKIPAKFVPIAERYRDVDNLGRLTPGERLSENVRAVKIAAEVSGSASHLPVAAGVKVQFTCETRSGAALTTNHEATHQRALALTAMKDYMIKNCHSWLQLVEELGRPVEMHDIIFVRECILTGDWASITWDKSSCESEVSFHVGASDVANVASLVWGKWDDHVNVPKRQGPLRSGFTYSLSNFDQCIFLKGMRIALRDWYRKLSYFLKVKATDAGEDLTEPSRLPTVRRLRNYACRVETVGSIDSSFRPVQNAYDILAIVIFEESDADLAVIDDDDLFSLQINTIGTLEEICDVLLENRDISASVLATRDSDSCKVGRICLKESESPAFDMVQESLDNLVLLDEFFEQLHSDIEPNHSASENISYSHSGGNSELDLKAVSTKSVDPAQGFEGSAIPNTNVLHLQSDPLYPQAQFDLSLALYHRFQQSGEQEYLDESIVCGRTALQLCPKDRLDRCITLNSLADSLRARFERSERAEDIEECITLQRAALALCPEGHPDRSKSLQNLVVSLNSRFQINGAAEDIDECITLQRAALALRPKDTLDCCTTLNNLAYFLRARFQRSGRQEDLKQSISLRCAASVVCPEGHPDHSESPDNLADSLDFRLQKNWEADLEDAITFHRTILVLRPEGLPDCSTSLHNLADSLRTRFERSRQVQDIDACITLNRAALVLRPEGHPDRCITLNSFADSLQARFKRSERVGDIDECITLQRTALVLCPEGHPDHTKLLQNLVVSLNSRFQINEAAEDIDECITLQRAVLVLRPEGHPDHSKLVQDLEDSLRTRFERSGRVEDIDECITLQRDALVLCPEGHPGHSKSVHNLADSLRARFERSGRVEDIDECITLQRDALVLCPEGHPGHSKSVHNLADSLRARFERSERVEDIDECITLQRAALVLRPEGHPDRSKSLYNLADRLWARFERSKQEEDIVESCSLYDAAQELNPRDY